MSCCNPSILIGNCDDEDFFDALLSVGLSLQLLVLDSKEYLSSFFDSIGKQLLLLLLLLLPPLVEVEEFARDLGWLER